MKPQPNQQPDNFNLSPNEILKAMMNHKTTKPDIVPKGFMSIAEYADLLKLSRRSTDTRVNKLYANGKLERRIFKIETGVTNKLINVAHYRLKK